MSEAGETSTLAGGDKSSPSPRSTSPLPSRSISVPVSVGRTLVSSPRNATVSRPLANFPPESSSGEDQPPPPKSPAQRTKSTRHSRSASVPSARGFPPFQAQPSSSERVGRDQIRSSPRFSKFSLARAKSGFQSTESDLFKPFSEPRPASQTSPVQAQGADSSRQLHLKLSRKSSGFIQEEGPGPGHGLPGPSSGADSPRSSTPPDQRSVSKRAASPRRDEQDTRVVYINNPDRTFEKSPVANNKIRTSKYTFLTFLPRNLFEQFHRIAYIYFLIIVVLNQIPQLAVFGRTASLFPLVFVLVITAVKDAYEDWGRHRSDRTENNRLSQVLQEGHFKPKNWKHIRVGEVIKIYSNETVPCDMVLLGTSDASGVAYVQTLNLDGESNLKSRYARQETSAKHPETGPISGTLICETPNRNIYDFSAYMDLDGVHLPLGPKNIILRGCELKNTSWVVGVAVYAGSETKAMLNSSGTQSKRSRLEQEMNRETLWLGSFLLIICLVGGIGMGVWLRKHDDELNQLPYYRKKSYSTSDDGDVYNYYGVVGEAIFGFLSCIIVFQIMVPISLYISMELVRLGQAYFMTRDIEMYHEAADTPFQCRALNINEDLGQIKYIFSDKTGTLTENTMEFFSASINGVDYSDAKVSLDAPGEIEGIAEVVEVLSTRRAWKPKTGAKVDPNLVKGLQNSLKSEEVSALQEYFLVLAACNTIVPTMVSISQETGQLEMQAVSSEGGTGLIEYQGESPDEQALVAAAAAYGYTLLERNSSYIVIDVLGEIQRFEVLGIHEFDSVRKRMSVIVRGPDEKIKLLMKGADAAVLDLLGHSDLKELAASTKSQDELQTATVSHLDRYAREGLRTLVVAAKELDPATVDRWRAKYNKASSALADRAGLLRAAAEVVEKNLTLLGATGIEDKLQKGVPETIALLREAGLQVWVLTGDKQETAISIAFSCMLLTRDMQQIIVNETTMDGCREALASAKATYGIRPQQQRREFFRWRKKKTVNNIAADGPAGAVGVSPNSELLTRNTGQPLALIIDGNSLVYCLSEELEQELYEVGSACKVVVCCRVAPLQKAGVVSLVKRKTKGITLAIGDGANDVSMIQMADVGIGISGQEGRQAVMASDFAMGQFRFLKRLLLVHGHWNYARLGYMVLYNFYRNAVFVMMLFWYILYAAFSPQTAISDWNLVFFSLIYTSIPTIVVGILDKDVSHKTLLRYPPLYMHGQRGASYSQALFWAFMLDTLWQSLVLFYVPYFTFRHSDVGIWGLGSLWTISVVVLVNIHLAMDIHRWTYIHHIAVWGSILATWICMLVMDSLTLEALLPQYRVIYHTAADWRYWFDILLILALALLPRFCVKVFWQRFFPSDIQIALEAEVKGHHGGKVELGVELSEVPHSPEPASSATLSSTSRPSQPVI
ncbi:hypothetical protein R1sor_021073 [Riccia sorocarpa]|uniref:Phospholipid-transporting ATPase n=1 Tax=Riccia sorocarpa TaxID=122646 RepID=A0ABD3GHT6_9MARC